MIEPNIMGPGFFIFFQTEEIESGGWFPAYIPKVRYKFKDEEEKEAAEIVEDLVVLQPIKQTHEDLELVLRSRLQTHDIRFKNIYLNWLLDEHKKYAKAIKQKRRKEMVLLLLH